MKSILLIAILQIIIPSQAILAHQSTDVKEMIKQARNHMYQHPSEAIKYADSAVEKAEELKNKSLLFETKVLLGAVYSVNGNYDLALESYMDAENYINYDDAFGVADFNINMASMYLSLENYYKAHVFNDLAYKIFKEFEDAVGISWCLNLRGLIYAQEKEYEKAQQAMDSSLYIHKKMNNEEGIYILANNLTAIPGNEEEKIHKLNDAISYNMKYGNKWTLAENYNNMGLLYIRLGELDKAKTYLNEAMSLADSLHANTIKRDNLTYSAELAVLQNKYKEAYLDYKEIERINELINSVDKVQQIEEEAYKRKQIVHTLNLEKKDLQLKSARQRAFVFFVIIILTIIIILLIIRNYHLHRVNRLIETAENEKKRKVELKKQLDHKEDVILNQTEILNISKKEMTDLVYFIKSKDKLLDNILSMLQEAQKKSVEDPKIRIKSVIGLIKGFREKELKTDLFINEINKNEQAFLDRLKLAHEDLSKNEIVLATLLRIGLSSKEIALLIESNPKTVNMARYRLRKKLNLETDDSLVAYFESL
ncbi:MAG: tetratricopeptide repeat protein [Bacteroidales bacterium]